jgi:hypothetical protein
LPRHLDHNHSITAPSRGSTFKQQQQRWQEQELCCEVFFPSYLFINNFYILVIPCRGTTRHDDLHHHHHFVLPREAQEQAELAKRRAERSKIQQQFAVLKCGLSLVTDEEWENIPEVGNLTREKRRHEG